MPVRYFVECVSKIKRILSVIHYTIYGAVCRQFPHFPCGDWSNIYTLSHYHQQIGSMNCKSLLRSWPWNNGIRCMSLYIVILIWHTNPIDLSTFETRPNDSTNKSIFLRSDSQFWCHHFMFLTEMYHETSDRSLVRVTCAVIKDSIWNLMQLKLPIIGDIPRLTMAPRTARVES